MRWAILSDIHSNIVALEAVLADLEGVGIDQYLCLGDIVGYGARPNQCCDRIRGLGAISISGNHDEAAVDTSRADRFTAPARACIIWTAERLREDNREFLRSLPQVRVVEDRITICHGSIPDPGLYTVSPADALLSLQMMQTRIAFFGHTHYCEWFVSGDDGQLPEEHPSRHGGEVHTEDGRRYLINPGAVGQPRDGNEDASYAIYDDETGTVTFRRVPYDIALTARQIEDAGLPQAMSARLWLGI